MSNFDKHADDLIGNMIAGIVEAQVAGLNAGADAAERRMIPALRTLEREYFAALIDPQTKMKTSLQLAILAVLMVVPSAITERVNDYANGKIKADQLARHEGKPEHDTDVVGRAFKAGF